MENLKKERSEIYSQVQERVRVENKRNKKDRASFVRFLEQEKTRSLEHKENKHSPFCQVAV